MNYNENHLRNLIVSQFEVSWKLLEIHLSDLDDEECIWKSSKKGLFMNKIANTWKPDWPETEAYDIGPPNIAWITWHIIFWWSMVIDYSFGKATLKLEDIQWPGNIAATKDKITNLRNQWMEFINKMPDEELYVSKHTHWPFTDKPFYEVISWLNIELMKNAAEIGYCRFLYASQHKID